MSRGVMGVPEEKHFSFTQKQKMSPDDALRKNSKNLTWLPHHGHLISAS